MNDSTITTLLNWLQCGEQLSRFLGGGFAAGGAVRVGQDHRIDLVRLESRAAGRSRFTSKSSDSVKANQVEMLVEVPDDIFIFHVGG
jgi:hypothetical protein